MQPGKLPMAAECIGDKVASQAAGLAAGQVLLLENLRFHATEEQNDESFARVLAGLADIYVNDAFGAAHRAHASTEGVTRFIDTAVSGLLMDREVTYLDEALKNPQRPFIAILGGKKISGKIEVIEHLLDKVDVLLIGGGMSYTFFKVMGLQIGDSLLEEDRLDTAKNILAQAEAKAVEFLLPIDCVVADRFAVDAQTQVVARDAMPEGWEGMDIGPETRKLYEDKVAGGGTVVWNGPLGVFEMQPFAQGTLQVAEALVAATGAGAVSIIGGGDTAAALTQAGLAEGMTHISTGGGASLECMGGRALPGVEALVDKEEQVVRLLRSKGVGVYFVTQNPADIPDSVLGQLGNRIQHALRAYTPSEQKGLKAASDSFRPNPAFDTTEAIPALGVGAYL